MNKKLLILLTTITMLLTFGAVSVNAETMLTDDGVFYLYRSGTTSAACIIDYDSSHMNYSLKGKITIPSKIKGYKVTSIDILGFMNCQNMTEVVIPNTVTDIDTKAFYGCTNLKTVTIPRSVTSIEADAFAYCYNLTTINYGGSKEEFERLVPSTSSNYMYLRLLPTVNYAIASPTPTPTPTPIPNRTLKYDSNGGTGTPQSITVPDGTYISVTSSEPSRLCYNFLGWSQSKSANQAEYRAGDYISLKSNTTLYAVWEHIPMPETEGNQIIINNKDFNNNNIKFDVELISKNEISGKVIVSEYSQSGILLQTKSYTATNKVSVNFEKKEENSTFKIYWWYDMQIIYPMCDALILNNDV